LTIFSLLDDGRRKLLIFLKYIIFVFIQHIIKEKDI